MGDGDSAWGDHRLRHPRARIRRVPQDAGGHRAHRRGMRGRRAHRGAREKVSVSSRPDMAAVLEPDAQAYIQCASHLLGL